MSLGAIVVDYIAVADQPVLSVAGIRIEGHIADHAQVRVSRLHCADSPADQILRVVGLFRFGRLHCRIGDWEEGHDRDAQLFGSSRLFDQQIDRQPLDAGHGGDGLTGAFSFADEDRPDQVGGR